MGMILQLMGGKCQSSLKTKNWIDFSFRIYREAIQAGVKPKIRILNLVVSCLRTPIPASSRIQNRFHDEYWIQKARKKYQISYDTKFLKERISIKNELTTPILMALDFDNEGSWDPRALQLIKENISLGILPYFSLSKKGTELIDSRQLPPQVSELYLIYLLSSVSHFMWTHAPIQK